jgi:hypothetical protein
MKKKKDKKGKKGEKDPAVLKVARRAMFVGKGE